MGLGELTSDDDALHNQEHLTIGDLKDILGEEAVRRGLEYMRSLPEAEKEFIRAADPDRMTEGYRKAGVRGDIDPVSEKWSAEMKEEGLGIDRDED